MSAPNVQIAHDGEEERGTRVNDVKVPHDSFVRALMVVTLFDGRLVVGFEGVVEVTLDERRFSAPRGADEHDSFRLSFQYVDCTGSLRPWRVGVWT